MIDINFNKLLSMDIETVAVSDEKLLELQPFREQDVKYGNAKKEEKRQEILEAARDGHLDMIRDKAALSPLLGRVLCIGMYSPFDNDFTISDCSIEENKPLTYFWQMTSSLLKSGHQLVGCNLMNFDLPFLIRRSWALGVKVPPGIVSIQGRWANWHPGIIDMRRVWQLGDTQAESNFDIIGKTFNTGGKCEGDHGADFARLWNTDRDAAIAYLKNDCVQPVQWLRRIVDGN